MKLFLLIHVLAALCGAYLGIKYLVIPPSALGALWSFLLCFLVLWGLFGLWQKKYFKLVLCLGKVFWFFVKEFFRSNIKLTLEILTPKHQINPAIVKVPLNLKSDLGIMALTNMANLTPGTLVIGVSDDKKFLFMHTLYLEGGSLEGFKKYIKTGLEHHLVVLDAFFISKVQLTDPVNDDRESIKRLKDNG